MKRLLICLSMGALSACGKEGRLSQPPASPASVCTAAVGPGTFAYSVAGGSLVLTEGRYSRQLHRVSAPPGERPVYGTWLLSEERDGKTSVTIEVEISPEELTVTSACRDEAGGARTARATVPVAISDHEIRVMSAREESVRW